LVLALAVVPVPVGANSLGCIMLCCHRTAAAAEAPPPKGPGYEGAAAASTGEWPDMSAGVSGEGRPVVAAASGAIASS